MLKINICNPSGSDCGPFAEFFSENPEIGYLMTGIVLFIVIIILGYYLVDFIYVKFTGDKCEKDCPGCKKFPYE